MKLVRNFVFALAFVVVVGCKQSAPSNAAVEPPVVTDTSTDLLLTWVDDKGEFHVEQKVSDVPVSARDVVRVADPAKEPAKAEEIFVADLRNLGPAGSYAVRTMPRSEFEKLAVGRRSQDGGSVLSARAADSALPAATRPNVIIYGASWCGPCHQAAAYFKSHGVAFIEKDIEQDSGAAREMHAKLASAGKRGGSIPVIDVRGKLVVGFDEGSIARALAAKPM